MQVKPQQNSSREQLGKREKAREQIYSAPQSLYLQGWLESSPSAKIHKTGTSQKCLFFFVFSLNPFIYRRFSHITHYHKPSQTFPNKPSKTQRNVYNHKELGNISLGKSPPSGMPREKSREQGKWLRLKSHLTYLY